MVLSISKIVIFDIFQSLTQQTWPTLYCKILTNNKLFILQLRRTTHSLTLTPDTKMGKDWDPGGGEEEEEEEEEKEEAVT